MLPPKNPFLHREQPHAPGQLVEQRLEHRRAHLPRDDERSSCSADSGAPSRPDPANCCGGSVARGRGSRRRARRRPTRRSPERGPVPATSAPASAARTSASNVRAMPMPFSCCGQPSYASSGGERPLARGGSTRRTTYTSRRPSAARNRACQRSTMSTTARASASVWTRISSSRLCALTPSGTTPTVASAGKRSSTPSSVSSSTAPSLTPGHTTT